MTIEEMRQHKWVVSWSGGKDSTATIIKMHEMDIPIEKIVYARMMYNKDLPATLPVMTQFVDRVSEVFRSWGYTVEIVPSCVNAVDIVERVYTKSKHEDRNGNKYGITAFARGCCEFSKAKGRTVKLVSSPEAYEMVGYCADETSRLHRLNDHKDSILYRMSIREIDCFDICKQHNMLSPLYNLGFPRDGCWFCPNMREEQRQYLKTNYPELFEEIKRMRSLCNYDISSFKRNNWLKEEELCQCAR